MRMKKKKLKKLTYVTGITVFQIGRKINQQFAGFEIHDFC
jgi:hypothetical protein